jgi:hypothetical protein
MPSVATKGVIPSRVIARAVGQPGGQAGEDDDEQAEWELARLAIRHDHHEDDPEREGPGDGEVEAALLDDERLADGRDGQHPGEREHRLQRALGEAAGSEERAHDEQQQCHRPDGDERTAAAEGRREATRAPLGVVLRCSACLRRGHQSPRSLPGSPPG